MTEPPVPARPATRRRLSVDLTPLRTAPEFRRLWTARAVSFFGTQVTYVAVPYQVYQLTGSPLAVGLLGLCELLPLLLTSFVGGALADVRDRRLLFTRAEAGLAAVSALLLVNALLPQPRLWALYLLVAAGAAADGISSPSLNALVPRLVPRDQVPAASALQALYGTVGFIAGPALAGVLISLVGLPAVYTLDLATFVFSLSLLRRMAPVPPTEGADPPGLRAVLEGVRYAWRDKVLLGSYAVDWSAMVFGLPTALYPALAERYGGPAVLGLLYAAPSAGSLLVTATSGWTARVRRHGLAICVAAGVWGVLVTALGFASSLWVALALLAATGAADMVSGLFRMTIWGQAVPDRLRGRLAGVEWAAVATGPALGNVEAGVVARLFDVRTAIVTGGVACVVAVVLLALALPAFVRYTPAEAPPS